MFSGIISDIGTISATQPRDGGLTIRITTQKLDLDDVKPGDSIAVNGVCLTVTQLNHNSFNADVSKETLNCSCGLDKPEHSVNLEKALRLADRLGGHLVSGHVDGIGEVISFIDIKESWELTIRAPQALARYIAAKGSITINGVSLTVNQVEERQFSVNLIPHTLQQTSLKLLNSGESVNLEIDLIARYCERILNYSAT